MARGLMDGALIGALIGLASGACVAVLIGAADLDAGGAPAFVALGGVVGAAVGVVVGMLAALASMLAARAEGSAHLRRRKGAAAGAAVGAVAACFLPGPLLFYGVFALVALGVIVAMAAVCTGITYALLPRWVDIQGETRR